MQLNEKILKFADEHDIYIMGHKGRDRKNKEIKCYSVSTDLDIVLGRIKPDCSYEQFLEKIALNAICESERLSDVITVMEEEYAELCEDYTALKEEATNEG